MNLINRLILLIIIFSITSSICQAQNSSELKLKNQNNFIIDTTKRKIKLEERSPLLAGTLSFIVPGLALGQIYNEDYGKFGIHAGISAGIFLFTIIAGQSGWIEAPFYSGEGTPKESKGQGLLAICVIAYLGNWLWSTIDAIHSAAMYNREIKQQRKSGFNNKHFRMGFIIDEDNQLKLKAIINL